jgi:hypothetical protein
MNKSKFIMAGAMGYSMKNKLNDAARDGWQFVKMMPFFQQQKLTAAHGISRFNVWFKKDPEMISYYKAKFIEGNSQGYQSFRVDDINEYNECMEKCYFEFRDFHHITVFHLDPEYNTRRSMKGYLCIWEISLEREMVEKMFERMEDVVRELKKEYDAGKLQEAPRPSRYLLIENELNELKEKRKKEPIYGISPDPKEEALIRRVEAYKYLYKTIEKIIDLDNKALQKQLGKDWDSGLESVASDIDAVIDCLSYDFEINNFVEDVLWSSQGNLIYLSLSDEVL